MKIGIFVQTNNKIKEWKKAMDSHSIYRKLQKHLNRQAVGFPATRSGVEINILKHIFSPHDAEIATHMIYKPETADEIIARMGSESRNVSVTDLENQLEKMIKNGCIHSKTENGKRFYALAPLIVGMYEMQNHRMTNDFVKNFNEYTSGKNFGIEFLSTEVPQMRTVPIAESLTVSHEVGSFDDVKKLIEDAREPFVIVDCICRKKKEMEGEICRVTQRTETCLAMADSAEGAMRMGIGRSISRQEALSIIEQNQKEGLVLQPSNSREPQFICSCCGCCCGILGMHQMIPNPLRYWATNFHVMVNADLCNGCGICAKRCQVNAIGVVEKKAAAHVDLTLCLGCGNCVPSCPKMALSLEKNNKQINPPQTFEDLNDLIMKKKKGPLGKLGVALKLAYDAIRTGRTDVLKG